MCMCFLVCVVGVMDVDFCLICDVCTIEEYF